MASNQVLHFIVRICSRHRIKRLLVWMYGGEDPEADSEEVQAVCRETSEKISSFVMTLFKAD